MSDTQCSVNVHWLFIYHFHFSLLFFGYSRILEIPLAQDGRRVSLQLVHLFVKKVGKCVVFKRWIMEEHWPHIRFSISALCVCWIAASRIPVCGGVLMVSKFNLPHSFITSGLVNKAVFGRTTPLSDFANMLHFHFLREKILERMWDDQKGNKMQLNYWQILPSN